MEITYTNTPFEIFSAAPANSQRNANYSLARFVTPEHFFIIPMRALQRDFLPVFDELVAMWKSARAT
ncbi:MAG: hypothetical protein U1F87_00345 [Kiritimatiellia bacterium]